jgi:hypothetical protein
MNTKRNLGKTNNTTWTIYLHKIANYYLIGHSRDFDELPSRGRLTLPINRDQLT